MKGCIRNRLRWIFFIAVAFLLLSQSHLVFGLPHAAKKDSDLYKELGVPRKATKTEIKKAFRALTMEHHPDLKDTMEEKEEAKAKMLKVLHAYEVLSDEEQRAEYDESGYVGHRIPDLNEFTSLEEVFQFFHQQTPLVSKSRQLESLTELERILYFHGPKLFLIQVYADSNDNSRQFAPSWEALLQTPLVLSGAVEMYRIDAYSPEGSRLVKKLGITFRGNSPPPVFAVVDGERWSFIHTKTMGMSLITGRLLDFVMNFFYESSSTVREDYVDDTESLIQLLQEPLPEGKKIRLLMHSMDSETIPVVLQVRYPEVEVFLLERNALQKFAEYCGQKITAKDRFGDDVAMPEFMIGVVGPLASTVQPSATATPPKLSCANVHIGVSAYMAYHKAAKFTEELIGDAHPDMKGITHIDSFHFFSVCREDCLLYIRHTCDAAPAPVVQLLQRNYRKVKPGYVCLDSHPKLKAALEAGGSEALVNVSAPFLAAVVGSNDKHLFPIFAENGSQDPTVLTAGEVDGVLAKLILKEEEEHTYFPFIHIAAGIAALLETQGFPLSSSQRYSIMTSRFIDSIQPYMSSTLPFLVMYLVHRFVLNRNKSPVKPVNKTGKKMGAIFEEDDIFDAKDGKGFLILVVDQRPAASGPLTLPAIANDQRFTVRVLSTEHRRWKKWLEKNQPKVETEGEQCTDEQIGLLAIRQTKMTGAIKSKKQSIEDFLRDILDGTCPTSISVPYTVLM